MGEGNIPYLIRISCCDSDKIILPTVQLAIAISSHCIRARCDVHDVPIFSVIVLNIQSNVGHSQMEARFWAACRLRLLRRQLGWCAHLATWKIFHLSFCVHRDPDGLSFPLLSFEKFKIRKLKKYIFLI